MSIAVIGAGAWGTALANVWAMAGTDVTLVCRDEGMAETLRTGRENVRYLPGARLAETLSITSELDAVAAASVIAPVVPVQVMDAVLPDLKTLASDATTLVLCSKGIHRALNLSPIGIARQSGFDDDRIAVLSGPSFAADVVRNKPTAVTLAMETIENAEALCGQLSTSTLRLYAEDDTTGVELGGALKNVIALAVGMTRGLDLGASAEAALTTRGLVELTTLVVGEGGSAQTCHGLSGLGDLILTCSSSQSRNFAYGVALAQGEDLLNRPLAEGVHTAAMAADMARRQGIAAPIITAVDAVLRGDLAPAEAAQNLLSRPLKREHDKDTDT